MATNFALASNGAAAASSSNESASLVPANAINGLRHTGNNWGGGGGWSGSVPGWLEVTFPGLRRITEIDVFTLADAVNYNADPTLADTFANFGIEAFTLEYWDGSAWQTITSVAGNNKVWRQFTGLDVTTAKLRISVSDAADPFARVVELEAWGEPPAIATTTLPSGVEGSAYSQQLAASGGAGSLTWSLDSGSLPPGLSLSSSGLLSGTPSAVGTYNFTAKVQDAGGLTDTQALTVTIVSAVTTKWSEMGIVSKRDMIAWHHYDEDYSANGAIYDFSGHLRHLAQASSPPVLQSDVLNGHPGWYFDGTKNPLVYSGEAVTVRHGFILIAADEATFAADRGVLTGETSGAALAGLTGSTEFAELGYTSFRKSEVAYGSGDRQAPMSGAFAVVEFTFADGVAMDGIQVGRYLADVAKRFKGWFVEQILYGSLRTDVERVFIYEYFAMRYHLWSKNAAGRNIFPFAANKTRGTERDREHYLSDPYSGDQKALIRGNFESGYELPFALRRQEEYEAAEAFWEEHYPLGKFVFRDHRYYPAKEVTCKFNSPIREQGSDVTYRFNYSFEIETA